MKLTIIIWLKQHKKVAEVEHISNMLVLYLKINKIINLNQII